MKRFLYDLEWYLTEFLKKFVEYSIVIIAGICTILYYLILAAGDVFILWLIHKGFVWAGL
jgi:hypothetical protein